MITINCPFCEKEVTLNIANAYDENGEIFRCPHCEEKFRYVLE